MSSKKCQYKHGDIVHHYTVEAQLLFNRIGAAAATTIWQDDLDIKDLTKMLRSEHSPIHAAMFEITLEGIPSFIATHFTRHSKVGQLHYVSSCREDRGYTGSDSRWAPVKQRMYLNPQHIMSMSKQRLCMKSHAAMRHIWKSTLDVVIPLMPELSGLCHPKCVYVGRCDEFDGCGYWKAARSRGLKFGDVQDPRYITP